MPKKGTCPNCKNETFWLSHCTHCGAELVKEGVSLSDRLDEIIESETTEARFAAHFQNMQRDLKLETKEFGKFLAFKRLPGSHFMGIRKLGVPNAWKAIVYAEHGNTVMALGPGLYPISKMHIGANPLAGYLDTFQGTSLSIFLVCEQVFPVTFIVPESEGPFKDLSACNIRSAEGFIGGALATLMVKIQNAEQLLNMFRGTFEPSIDSVDTPSTLRILMSPFEFLLRFAVPERSQYDQKDAKAQESNQLSQSITADILWQNIRSEFVQVVRASLINESAEDMANSIEVRNRIQSAISEGMQSTLQRYGLEIIQVSAFQFLCPEYDAILRKNANAAREVSEVESERTMAEVRDQRRKIAEQDAIGSAQIDKNIEIAQIDATAQVQRKRIQEEEDLGIKQTKAGANVSLVQDEAKADAKRREMSLDSETQDHLRTEDGRNQDHIRTQRDKNFRLDAEQQRINTGLQFEKAQRLLELRNAQLDADARRRIEYVKVIAETGLSSDSILALQLAEHPELAQAYAEAVRAKGYEERIALQAHFEKEILGIGIQDKKNVQRLLEEGIRQAGFVLSENQRKQRPQITVSGNLMHQIETGPKAPLTPIPEDGETPPQD